MALVFTDRYEKALLTKAVDPSAVAGVLGAPGVTLYAVPVNPTAGTTFADLTVPSYTAYAPQDGSFGTPYQLATGTWEAASVALMNAQIGMSDPSQQIAGYALTDTISTTNLLACEDFATPVQLVNGSELLSFSVRLRFGDESDNGTAVIVSQPS